MTKKIIGLLGFISSGKGTVGEYLVSQHNFQSMSFASSLKDAVAAIFGWPRNLLEGDTKESRDWRETVDTYWTKKLGMNITPRWILQHFGTDLLRNQFADNIWVWSLERTLLNTADNIVITDVRFPNEIKMLNSINGKLIWVQRGNLPEWYDLALSNKKEMKQVYPTIHESEYAWIGCDNFVIIDNNRDLEYLYQQVDKCLKS